VEVLADPETTKAAAADPVAVSTMELLTLRREQRPSLLGRVVLLKQRNGR
jgi:hypothetical protein